MARVMAVSFETYGRLHYLDAGDDQYTIGDWVLYPTSDGAEVAQCVWGPEEVSGISQPLPRCGGHATDEDHHRDETNRNRRAEAVRIAKEMIAARGLAMKVIGADFLDHGEDFDRMAAIYYTALRRVDFRALLGELARAIGARIDLRQIGSRDAARILGGVGSCGRELCCATFFDDFEPVSLRLARVQGLPANPLQISGACGRLMCCLKYEHPLYVDFIKRAPALGERIQMAEEEGIVVGHHVPAQEVTVRHTSGEIVRCPLESVCSAARKRRVRVNGTPEGS